jgi:hypothetical protein
MKTAFFLLFCGLCAAAAFGQNVAGAGAMSAQPVPIAFQSRPEHASQMSLKAEQNILGSSTNISAHGERPLWECVPTKVEVPLGDIARELRKEHTVARRSARIFENQ